MKLHISKDSSIIKDADQIQVGSYNISISGFDNITINNDKYRILLSGDIYNDINESINTLNDLIDSSLSDLKICGRINELIDGRYAFVLINEICNEIYVGNDQYGRQDIFYKFSDSAYVSDNLNSLRFLNKTGFNNFAVAHTIITTIGARPPKKHTALNDIKRIGLHQILIIKENKASSQQNKFKSRKILDYNSSYLKKHSNTYLETIEKLGSKNENIVFLSSGWDSTAILASLNHVFGNKKIKAVTWRLTISERSGVFNKFEIERAKKFCDYFDIPLHIVDTDYVNEGKQLYDGVLPFLKKYGYHPFTSFSHYYIAEKASKIKENDDCVLFSGEISDGAYNLGFSQYISTFHPSPGFREYSDKMLCYLYGPTFLKECLNGKGLTDPIYQFFKKRFDGKVFDEIARDEEKLITQILLSFFGRNERFPFLSVENYKFLTSKGMVNYDKTLQSEYFNDLSKLSIDNIYSIILYLYNSFHWNGSSVNTLYNAAEYHGMRLRLPYYDPKMQEFLAQMPEDWGRGLDLNPVKYPLKHYLANEIDYPLDLQRGPHSYLYDIDEEYLNPPFEFVMHSMKSVYKDCLNNFDIDSLDKNYFNTKYLNNIINDYRDKDNIEKQNFNPLYGLLNFILTEGNVI